MTRFYLHTVKELGSDSGTGKQHQEVEFDDAGNFHNEKRSVAHPRHCHKGIRESRTYSLRRDLILKSYSLFAVWCEIFELFYFQHKCILELNLCLC